MISTFVLLTIVGGVCRLGLNWVLRRKLAVSVGLPPILDTKKSNCINLARNLCQRLLHLFLARLTSVL